MADEPQPVTELTADGDDSLRRAIHEGIRIVPYDPGWPLRFESERERLAAASPLLELEHIGSTAVPGMSAKPIIDCMATVTSIWSADEWVERLCENGYTTSATYNRSLGDRRWLMRHAAGRRTHHLHLVLAGSSHLADAIRFRDLLRADGRLAAAYADLKFGLAETFAADREAYTAAKTAVVADALAGRG